MRKVLFAPLPEGYQKSNFGNKVIRTEIDNADSNKPIHHPS